jgi:hypothetical protein
VKRQAHTSPVWVSIMDHLTKSILSPIWANVRHSDSEVVDRKLEEGGEFTCEIDGIAVLESEFQSDDTRNACTTTPCYS